MVTFSVPVDDGDSKCIDYLIVGDYIKEEDEIFTVSASALNGVKANIMNTFSVTIQDHGEFYDVEYKSDYSIA